MSTKRRGWSTLGLGFAALLLGPLPASATPTLIGDSIVGSLVDPGSFITTQFTSPQTVGGGIEFTGLANDVFGQVWDFFVDVGASEFSIGWTERTRNGDGNIWFGGPGLGLSLSSLNFSPPASISGVLNSGYACTGSTIGCGTWVGSGIQALSFTGDSINVEFQALRSGEVYTFAVSSSAVPEPGTLALLGLGLAGLGLRRRRKAA